MTRHSAGCKLTLKNIHQTDNQEGLDTAGGGDLITIQHHNHNLMQLSASDICRCCDGGVAQECSARSQAAAQNQCRRTCLGLFSAACPTTSTTFRYAALFKSHCEHVCVVQRCDRYKVRTAGTVYSPDNDTAVTWHRISSRRDLT